VVEASVDFVFVRRRPAFFPVPESPPDVAPSVPGEEFPMAGLSVVSAGSDGAGSYAGGGAMGAGGGGLAWE
jgi:hypothetical protein